VAAVPQNSNELLNLIDRSGLIPLDRIRERLSGQAPPATAVSFAKWLVQGGMLTNYQAEQFLNGKSRGFYLGNYRVLERLGGGATAGVFLCEHRVMNHRVAVKVLDQQLLLQDANTLLRFRREARAAAALSHPNIVRTLDFDEDAGRHFLVMEYVEGVTLDQWMKRNPKAPPRAFVNFILQAALGLHHIHRARLIHRDLKPGNLLLDKQGTVKILDLGLAKFTEDNQDVLSHMQGASIIGTVDFMSPEQAEGGRELDVRADIYSLGATLYYLLTGGQIPFPMATLGAKLIAIQFEKPRPLRDCRPDLDPKLAAIVERMMAKNREHRFESPKDLILALEGWMNGAGSNVKKAPVSAKKVRTAKPKPELEAVVTAEPFGGADEVNESSGRWLIWSLRAAAFALLLTVLVLWKPWNSGHKAAAQGPSPSVSN
jgi:eukaryotic-like serine/threonine-protein kinase